MSKRLLLTIIVEVALLVVSISGFLLGMQDGHLLSLVLFGAVPLGVFVFIALREATGTGEVLSSVGYQSRIDALQKRLNVQDDFFHLINNNTPSTLTIYNDRDEYWFLNASAARELDVSENDIVGKKPVEVLGAEQGRKILKNLERVRETGALVEAFDQYSDRHGAVRYVQTRYHPLASFGEFPGGIMAWGENVTSIVIERERQENMLRQVISTLVAVVDRRDPYASGHSSRVGQLSRALAIELHLPPREIEAAEIAGSLMNFGKVLVSRAILTKTEALTPDELQRIRDSILVSADILSMIDFSAPVVPTLRQVLERYDGSGEPNKLTGDMILVTARIVAVANAFVAMVSPRAYRSGADFIAAADRLAGDAGKLFDPKVIAALQTFLKKDGAKLDWLVITKPSF